MRKWWHVTRPNRGDGHDAVRLSRVSTLRRHVVRAPLVRPGPSTDAMVSNPRAQNITDALPPHPLFASSHHTPYTSTCAPSTNKISTRRRENKINTSSLNHFFFPQRNYSPIPRTLRASRGCTRTLSTTKFYSNPLNTCFINMV